MIYLDRKDAGRRLAALLGNYAGRDNLLVLGLPRGGVPVAFEVAQALHAPLDIFLVRKLGVPGHEEYAMGAIASGGIRVINPDVMDQLDIDPAVVEAVAQREQLELERRSREYRGDRAEPVVAGKTVIVVDDGLATGSTMRAAVQALRAQGPAWLVVAVPVAPPSTCEMLRAEVDDIVCGATPGSFGGVGRWYVDFGQTDDEEVKRLLAAA